jgi:hypothetical protein
MRLFWTADDQRIYHNAAGGVLCSTSTDPNGSANCRTTLWEGFAALSPDGSTIAFNYFWAGYPFGTGGINLMNADGSGSREVLHFSGGEWWGTAWSADGKSIFFTTSAQRVDGLKDIKRLDIATGAVSTVASIFAAYDDGEWMGVSVAPRHFTPGTVPGRGALTYYAYGTGAWGYWTINEDGTGLRLVYSEEQLRAAIGSGDSPRLVNHESWEP